MSNRLSVCYDWAVSNSPHDYVIFRSFDVSFLVDFSVCVGR